MYPPRPVIHRYDIQDSTSQGHLNKTQSWSPLQNSPSFTWFSHLSSFPQLGKTFFLNRSSSQFIQRTSVNFYHRESIPVSPSLMALFVRQFIKTSNHSFSQVSSPRGRVPRPKMFCQSGLSLSPGKRKQRQEQTLTHRKMFTRSNPMLPILQ